ncbi:adenylate isopentenyltransferase 3, chloroplastic-like [Cynara cardunculus var. scolymus]|uniref:adenylate dimethylallyltransferase (ADP/ATP-dependent) n=1 Tax=Cynara cardunculus var. scolymus TaxID=59895 RepID=A0A103Y7H7_CYNCS|nr:adenylate isopentenyltransferase 3, chloroplastic-like [Cynara cardunculus var. scolymus]KVI03937.1 tRNA isopentenyltransferase [Cynara cardunculus var. scolymus]
MTMMICKQHQPSSLQIPIHLSLLRRRPLKEKVVVVMGATGTGKSRLSIDLATHHPAEIINSDKMQVYEGLDIVTNKITEEECDGVPHHLIGIVDPDADFTSSDFASTSSLAVKSIVGKGKLPIIAGGSNSFIEALVDDRNYEFRSRYDVCFLWVDVAMPVLHRFVSDRVNRMVAAGMVNEVRKKYNPNSDYSKGIRRAIGVPEFDSFFRWEYSASNADEKTRAKLLESAINETKINTCKLACQQLRKIHRLRNTKGWKIHRLDATKVFQQNGKEADEAWSELVAGPGSAIVSQFIHNLDHSRIFTTTTNTTTTGPSDGGSRTVREVERRTAMAAAAR